MKNYIKLELKFSLFNDKYIYVDVPEYLADQIFINKKLKVNFKGGEFRKDDCKYVIIQCKVRKKDREKFLRAMEELQNKMILFGYVDYDEFCEDLWNEMHKINEELINSHDPSVIVNNKLVH